MRPLSWLIVLAMLIGWYGQVHARLLLPQPAALAEKIGAHATAEPGMEPRSDLFGEAAVSEAQEREHESDRLHSISVTGWALSAVPGEPPAMILPVPLRPSLRPTLRLQATTFDLHAATLDPPRA